jgi:hypothetical protein
MTAIGALTLTDVRARAAAALAPATDGDPNVHTGYVDAAEPPALILNYEDPWIQPMTACLLECRLEVICVGSRVEPEPGLEALEALVTYTLTRMGEDVHSWSLQTVQAPRVFTIGGVPLLGARIAYSIRITA